MDLSFEEFGLEMSDGVAAPSALKKAIKKAVTLVTAFYLKSRLFAEQRFDIQPLRLQNFAQAT